MSDSANTTASTAAQPIANTHVTRFEPLTSPRDLKAEQPLSAAAEATVTASRASVERIVNKQDPRLLLIVGPCSIHDEAQALDYAGRLAALRTQYADRLEIVMRVYMDKPRTTVGWRGYLNDPHMDGKNDFNLGLSKTRRLMLKINELGMPVGTELLDPFVPQYIDDQLSWAAIGARTTESQTHRAMVSGISTPVGFKNGTGGNIKLAVDAIVSAGKPHTFLGITDEGQAAVVSTKGNPDGHVILRGGRFGPNYAAEHVQETLGLLTDAGVTAGIVVDCSHHNSSYQFEKQLGAWNDVIAQRVAGNDALVGLMLESNLIEGKQSIPADPADLKYGVSVTDACVGWQTTEELLKWAYDQMGAVMGQAAPDQEAVKS
ncbi:3-deoxy-7-phosphoheptulonate synthase [Deinococcus psychrotolerans]|uniref:Phospho-2-dehydro-3-deoxyheptonate aldolase n=1 Tax=Deinococcus psychrotolerans TaxID=2489213 RepID=A0A3G8YBA6_9DEIO|nr:3-deoxy-7-phosphoheptulonate synthase [Deinococcus psychrotolerans]AZI42355.1 3-deoxy-7-phosphoheptulonate synthase [Deinococcus psychrotolerans]